MAKGGLGQYNADLDGFVSNNNPSATQLAGWMDVIEGKSDGFKRDTIDGLLHLFSESGAYGSNWGNIASYLPASPTLGRTVVRTNTDESNETRIYVYNSESSNWDFFQTSAVSSGISTIADATDTNFSSLANNDLLQYNSSNSKWENKQNPTIAGNLTVSGNLTVDGTTTTINSTVTTIDDPIIVLGDGTSSTHTSDRGIEFVYYDGAVRTGFFGYDISSSRFTFLTATTNSSEEISGTIAGIDVGSVFISGTQKDTNWDTAYTHSQVTSGNPHSVTASDVGLGNVENTALSTFAGTTNITTLGTITTGTWQGTAIADTYISSASNWNSAYNNMVNSASFDTSTGVLTLTQQDSGTVTVDLDGKYLNIADIDDTAVDGVTTAPISSNWAYDHENSSSAHHDAVTLNSSVTNILSLSTQQISAVEPTADRLIMYDKSATALAYVTISTGLTLNASNQLFIDGSVVLQHSDVDDTSVDGATTVPISSNWAYDHENNASAHHTKYALTDDLTSSEITQIQNIDSTTISTTQWGYLGALDQSLTTTSDVTFAEVTGDEFIGDHRGAVIFKAKAGEGLTKGDAVYISSFDTVGNTPVVAKADADDVNKMPSFGLAQSTVSTNASVDIVTFGTLSGLDTSSFSLGDVLYVSTTAGVLTATAPSGESSYIQNIAKVTRSHASVGSVKVGGAGRFNAVSNLNDGNIFIGNSSNQATTSTLDTSIVPENTNLYYTDARARSSVSASGDLSYDSSTGVFSFTETHLSRAGSLDYLSVSDHTITLGQIDLSTDVTGVLPSANLDSDTAHLSETQTFTGAKRFDGQVNIDTDTNSLPLIISRLGSTTNENLKIGVDDRGVYFTHKQDETTGDHFFEFNIESTTSGEMYYTFQTGGTESVRISNNGLHLVSGATVSSILDEDTMSSNSATALATQQSIKAYVDSQVATANELSELTDVTLTSSASGDLLLYNGSAWVNTTTLTGDYSFSGQVTGYVDADTILTLGASTTNTYDKGIAFIEGSGTFGTTGNYGLKIYYEPSANIGYFQMGEDTTVNTFMQVARSTGVITFPLATTFSADLDINANVDVNGTIKLTADGSSSDNFISVGASEDLKIYHTGSASYINNTTNDLIFQNDDSGGTNVEYMRFDASANIIKLSKTLDLTDEEVRTNYGTYDKTIINTQLIDLSKTANLVPSDWAEDTSGSASTELYAQNGADTENSIVWGDGSTYPLSPHGSKALLWRAESDGDDASHGGFVSDQVKIDHTQTYQFSVWIYWVNKGDASGYHGVVESSTDILNLDGTSNTNPYFRSNLQTANVQVGEWYLSVGYVHGSGTTGTTNYGAVYRQLDGSVATASTDFRFTTSATTIGTRAFMYYDSSGNAEAFFFDPRIHLVDGSEPSPQQLLGSDPRDFVTLSTTQTITGAKTFPDNTQLYFGDDNDGNLRFDGTYFKMQSGQLWLDATSSNIFMDYGNNLWIRDAGNNNVAQFGQSSFKSFVDATFNGDVFLDSETLYFGASTTEESRIKIDQTTSNEIKFVLSDGGGSSLGIALGSSTYPQIYSPSDSYVLFGDAIRFNNDMGVHFGSSLDSYIRWDSANSTLALRSNAHVTVTLDDNNNSSNEFRINNGGDSTVFTVDESGKGHFKAGDSTNGLSTAISLELGEETVSNGALKLLNDTSASMYSIIHQTNNLHIDTVGGNIYLGYYDATTIYYALGTTNYRLESDGDIVVKDVTLAGAIRSNSDVTIHLDDNADGDNVFRIRNSGDTSIFEVDENANITTLGDIYVANAERIYFDAGTDGNNQSMAIYTSSNNDRMKFRSEETDGVFELASYGGYFPLNSQTALYVQGGMIIDNANDRNTDSGLYFGSGRDTGLYASATDTITFTDKIAVTNDATFKDDVYVNGTTDGSTARIYFQLNGSTSDQVILYRQSSDFSIQSSNGEPIVFRYTYDHDGNGSTSTQAQYYFEKTGFTIGSATDGVNTTAHGTLLVKGTISNDSFTIPNSIGSSGQVLRVPSSGTTLEWATLTGSGGTDNTINANISDVITLSGQEINATSNSVNATLVYDSSNSKITYKGTADFRSHIGLATGSTVQFSAMELGASNSTDARLTVSADDTSPDLSSATPVDFTAYFTNSDVNYGIMFGVLGSGVGLIQQRRSNTNTFYGLNLQPYGGNLGVALSGAEPTANVEILRSDTTGFLIRESGVSMVEEAIYTQSANAENVMARIQVDSANTNFYDMAIGLTMHNDDVTAGNYSPMIAFSTHENGNSGTGNSVVTAFITAQHNTRVANSWSEGDLVFGVNNGGQPYEAMRLHQEGNLEVSGNITATSFGSITEANLLDKSDAETITGLYSFQNGEFRINKPSAHNTLKIHSSNTYQSILSFASDTTTYRILLDNDSDSGSLQFQANELDYNTIKMKQNGSLEIRNNTQNASQLVDLIFHANQYASGTTNTQTKMVMGLNTTNSETYGYLSAPVNASTSVTNTIRFYDSHTEFLYPIRATATTPNTTEATAIESIANYPIQIEEGYTANEYVPLIGAYSSDDNATKSKVGIYYRYTSTGTNLYLGTSRAYATGVNKAVIVTNEGGLTVNERIKSYGNGGRPFEWGDTGAVGFLSFDGDSNALIGNVSTNDVIFSTENNSTEFMRLDHSASEVKVSQKLALDYDGDSANAPLEIESELKFYRLTDSYIFNSSTGGNLILYNDDIDKGVLAYVGSEGFRVYDEPNATERFRVAQDGSVIIHNSNDVDLTSTNHGLTIGSATSQNLAMDVNEIMARNNGSTAELFINGNGGSVSMGSSTRRATWNGTVLELNVTDDGSSTAPIINLRHISSTPADNDILGSIYFSGEDSIGSDTIYSYMRAFSTDVTNGDEDGELRFYNRVAGTLTNVFSLVSNTPSFNTDNLSVVGSNGTASIENGHRFTIDRNGLAYLNNQNSGTSAKLRLGVGSDTANHIEIDNNGNISFGGDVFINSDDLQVSGNSTFGSEVTSGKSVTIRGNDTGEGIKLLSEGGTNHFMFKAWNSSAGIMRTMHHSSTTTDIYIYGANAGNTRIGNRNSTTAYHFEDVVADYLRYDISLASFSGSQRFEELKQKQKNKSIFKLHKPYMADTNIEMTEALGRIKRLERQIIKQNIKIKDYEERISELEERELLQ